LIACKSQQKGGKKMSGVYKKSLVVFAASFVMLSFLASPAYSQSGKMGYVDLRRAFYEYEKTKKMETELNSLTEDRQKERDKMVAKITKLRDKIELLSGEARNKKQTEIDAELVKLQEFDRDTRQELLTKKNDMFREVVEDIQKVVEDLGKKEKYDYVFDSRNIMYAKEEFDLTDKVVKRLNK
jgi:outer membrane protein